MKHKAIVTIYIFISLVFACSKPSVNNKLVFKVSDVKHGKCKIAKSKTAGKEYIEYKTVNENYLKIRHFNVMFNCCPSKLTVNSNISNDTIRIFENELEHACKCMCPYDLEFQIGEMKYGKYLIILNKMNKEHIKFTIDFNANTNDNTPLN